MFKRLKKFKKQLSLEGIATPMAGTSCKLNGFIWTKGYLFNKGELYGYMAKISTRATSSGINHGHIVELDVDKFWCEKDGYRSTLIACFTKGDWSLRPRTESMRKIIRVLLRELEKLPQPPSKPIAVRVLMHVFQNPTKKQYRRRQKR